MINAPIYIFLGSLSTAASRRSARGARSALAGGGGSIIDNPCSSPGRICPSLFFSLSVLCQALKEGYRIRGHNFFQVFFFFIPIEKVSFFLIWWLISPFSIWQAYFIFVCWQWTWKVQIYFFINLVQTKWKYYVD